MKTNKNKNLIWISIIYLAGIFIGAIDTGIVTPARTIIQTNLNVNEQSGIWMITIYTLAYAASIPVMGKLADRMGRKYVYLISIFLFGIGSLFCGLSQNLGSFPVLLLARTVQAIGGGGILPIANAEFGVRFPEEKRGMALGLVGGVYGIANVFGASAGSLILDIFGNDQWQYIFYINIPIIIFILIAGFFFLENSRESEVSKIDLSGSFVLTVMILSLLYGLKNVDFFAFFETIKNMNVFPFLLIFLALIPIFIIIEKKAKDPVMNLKYFVNKDIIITLIISFISGFVMMSIIFVPQFAENALKIPSGSGGYLVIILGLFAGVGAPVSGKLIDKYGVKSILAFGFLISVIASLVVVFITTKYPSMLTIVISLILFGLGMGFTMGTPLNYMMLQNTDPKESNSALATLSLVRSIGTAISPAIMIGFIATAGANVQTNVMSLLPTQISVTELPYASEITDTINKLKDNPKMADQLSNIEIPDLSSMTKINIKTSGSSDYQMPTELISLMQSSDVTTITENTKKISEAMFIDMTPSITTKIEGGIQKGIDGIDAGIQSMESAMNKMSEKMKKKSDSMGDKIPNDMNGKMPTDMMSEMPADMMEQKPGDLQNDPFTSMTSTIDDMKDLKSKMIALKNAIPGKFEEAKDTYLNEIDKKEPMIEDTFQNTINEGFKNVFLTSAFSAIIALLVLLFYQKGKTIK